MLHYKATTNKTGYRQTDRQITSGPTTDYKADRHTSKQARTTVFGSLHHKRRVSSLNKTKSQKFTTKRHRTDRNLPEPPSAPASPDHLSSVSSLSDGVLSRTAHTHRIYYLPRLAASPHTHVHTHIAIILHFSHDTSQI